MDKTARRRELKAQYKQARTEMGVFAFRCVAKNRVYIGTSRNLPGTLNSIRFQLQNDSYPSNRRLLENWRQYGPEGFAIEVLEGLDYRKDDDGSIDYREDLAVLKELWREKLLSQGVEVENIQPKDR